MLTDLLLYLTSTNDGTARQLSLIAPGAEVATTTLIGQSLGSGELYSQGFPLAWPAGGIQPDPSGHGFVWDATTLELQRFSVGLWRPNLKIGISNGSVIADVSFRLYKLTASGTYEPIASTLAPATLIAAGNPPNVAFPAAVGAQTDFLSGDKLYLDVVVNVTQNLSGTDAATFQLFMNGGFQEQILTPGYDLAPSLPPDTVRDLCTDALVDLTAIQQGDTLAPEDADVAFRALNFLIDRANADRLLLHSVQNKSWRLTAHKGRYTIGKSSAPSDIAEPRPVLIQTAAIIIGGIRHDLDLNTSVQWAAIREKTNEAILPTALYCDYRWPVAALNFNPVPLCSDPTYLEMFYWEPLPKFESLDDEVDLPPAYRDFLRSSLALKLSLPFMKQPSQLLVEYALNSKADVRAFNLMQLAGMVGESTTGNIPQAPAPSVNPLNAQPAQ